RIGRSRISENELRIIFSSRKISRGMRWRPQYHPEIRWNRCYGRTSSRLLRIGCVFAIGEVYADSDIAEKSSIGTVSRQAIMQQPSKGSVLTHQPVFQGEVLPRFKGVKILVHTPFSIFGMNARNPILLQLLSQR